jgi:chorismate mutase
VSERRAVDDIERLDAQIIRLWQERVELTAALVRLRTNDGEPAYRHAEQMRMVTRYHQELDADGVELAHLLLRHALQ